MQSHGRRWSSPTAALVSSRGLTRPLPAAPEIPAESQKAAQALSEAFEAVADFVKPSVVQISVEHKAARPAPGRGGRMPFPGSRTGRRNIDPKDFEEMLKRFFGPEGRPEKQQFGRRSPRGPARDSSTTTRATS